MPEYVNRRVDYDGAFECSNCPGNADPTAGRACPDWWEWIEDERGDGNKKTGRQRIVQACGRPVMHDWMKQMMANNEFTTQNVVNAANRVEKGIGRASSLLAAFTATVGGFRETMRTYRPEPQIEQGWGFVNAIRGLLPGRGNNESQT